MKYTITLLLMLMFASLQAEEQYMEQDVEFARLRDIARSYKYDDGDTVITIKGTDAYVKRMWYEGKWQKADGATISQPRGLYLQICFRAGYGKKVTKIEGDYLVRSRNDVIILCDRNKTITVTTEKPPRE